VQTENPEPLDISTNLARRGDILYLYSVCTVIFSVFHDYFLTFLCLVLGGLLNLRKVTFFRVRKIPIVEYEESSLEPDSAASYSCLKWRQEAVDQMGVDQAQQDDGDQKRQETADQSGQCNSEQKQQEVGDQIEAETINQIGQQAVGIDQQERIEAAKQKLRDASDQQRQDRTEHQPQEPADQNSQGTAGETSRIPADEKWREIGEEESHGSATENVIQNTAVTSEDDSLSSQGTDARAAKYILSDSEQESAVAHDEALLAQNIDKMFSPIFDSYSEEEEDAEMGDADKKILMLGKPTELSDSKHSDQKENATENHSNQLICKEDSGEEKSSRHKEGNDNLAFEE
jgi:hypothetical protein